MGSATAGIVREKPSIGDLYRQTGVWGIGFIASLVIGAVFRLIWLQDIEYKGDQIWTFTHVQAFWATHHLPLIGMPSSARLPNAGMSIWAFILLSLFVPIENPLALTRAIEVLNVSAVLLLALFVWRCVETPEREPWLWSVALISVNPFAVLYSRCIWAQELLPIFTLGLLAGWWHRGRWAGAFAWGLIGALLGQIHMGGYFFAAAFVLCVLLFDRRSADWRAWLAGSVVGALPLIPSLLALAGGQQGLNAPNLVNLAPIFMVRWIGIATGIGLNYSLGHDFIDFIGLPVIGGLRTYGIAVLFLAIIAIAVIIVVRFGRRLRADRHETIARYFNLRSPTVLALVSACLGYGVLLCLTLRHVYIHYFVIAFSLPALSLAWLAHAGGRDTASGRGVARQLLAALVVAQAALTIAFLWYIHDHQVIDGDYGTAYGSQPHQVE